MGDGGILCALSSGDAFLEATPWSSELAALVDWARSPAYYASIAYPDLNGDGKSDLCARAMDGLYCAISDGETFGSLATWSPFLSDFNSWSQAAHYETIRYPDLNGDGKSDLCGRGFAGVFCSLSNGHSLSELTLWSGLYNDGTGWSQPAYYASMAYPDVNGDGRSDLCARGTHGVDCQLSNGVGFESPRSWDLTFSDLAGWRYKEYNETIAYADLNGDGKSDLCGRAASGVSCALSDGVAFADNRTWSTAFGDVARGYRPEYYETLQFARVNGDASADLCGRTPDGATCALSSLDAFGELALVSGEQGDSNGWTAPEYYRTMRWVDVDGDGEAEVCARGPDGVRCR